MSRFRRSMTRAPTAVAECISKPAVSSGSSWRSTSMAGEIAFLPALARSAHVACSSSPQQWLGAKPGSVSPCTPSARESCVSSRAAYLRWSACQRALAPAASRVGGRRLPCDCRATRTSETCANGGAQRTRVVPSGTCRPQNGTACLPL